MPGYDVCEKQHKVGIKLMCPLVEKLLKFKKDAAAGQKVLKRTVLDAFREQLNFHSLFFKEIFYFFDASHIPDFKCSMQFYVVQLLQKLK